jgi:hypothetical protein
VSEKGELNVMIHMLCRNKVADFAKWKRVFDSHAPAHREAGLKLEYVRRSIEDPNNVFFVFEVSDIEKARAFISAPGASEAAKASGVIDGEYHFVEDS